MTSHFSTNTGNSSPQNIAELGRRRHALVVYPEPGGDEASSTLINREEDSERMLLIPNVVGPVATWISVRELGRRVGLGSSSVLSPALHRALKRAADAVLALTALILIVPLMIVLAALVFCRSPGPVFYGQKRVGRYGRPFTAWKFRSMVVGAENVLETYLARNPRVRAEWNCNRKLKKDPRLTAIGGFLRKTSLDELPQIWNVLCGDMSLVGPRPIVTDEIPKYAERFEIYKIVRPGITGLWQISGRNDTTYEERTQLDEYYVRNWSIWFDFYILARTVKTVLLGEGAY